jgi:adenine/guanine phosphoribosyltransferase-like PRPP-binding protein
MSLETNIKSAIRDVADFPKPGIVFKDITPIFENQTLSQVCHLAQYQTPLTNVF